MSQCSSLLCSESSFCAVFVLLLSTSENDGSVPFPFVCLLPERPQLSRQELLILVMQHSLVDNGAVQVITQTLFQSWGERGGDFPAELFPVSAVPTHQNKMQGWLK